MQTFTDYIQENGTWLLSEAGLSRMLSRIESGEDLAIITAYRAENDKKTNMKRNRGLRGVLNKNKMGAYQVVGHWRECKNSNIEYSDCPKSELVDAIERSYLVIKPDAMESKRFLSILVELAKKYDQDGIVYRREGEYTIVNKRGGTEFKIGTNVSVGKIAQAYSTHVKKMNVPFVFEGIEFPATNVGKRMFAEAGILYPILNADEIKTAKKSREPW
jgi:hypothetical protein